MPIFLHRNSPELKDSHVACFNNRQKVFVHAIRKLCIRDASGFETGYTDLHSLVKYNCFLLIRFINPSSEVLNPTKMLKLVKLDWKWKLSSIVSLLCMENTNLHFSQRIQSYDKKVTWSRNIFCNNKENWDNLIVYFVFFFSNIDKGNQKLATNRLFCAKLPKKGPNFMKYVGSFHMKYWPRYSKSRMLLYCI